MMMNVSELQNNFNDILNKTKKSLALLEASIESYEPYDPSINYTSKEREPYDALCNRYERTVDLITNRLFRAFELLLQGVHDGSYRDCLNRLAKMNIIDQDINIWLGIKILRNKVAHDYLDGQLVAIYKDIMATFPILKTTVTKIENFNG
ncbi:MAG: hypothetical protein HQK49_17975 [Oligoflexia bacterium]|nr:hypothetical protein [Oligoflexia bacterium]